MTWDKGFNFRGSVGYVTDGTDETYVLVGDTYPTTRNGVTFGWESAPGAVQDRVNTVDRRLAGAAQRAFVGTVPVFRVDLASAGDTTLRVALGLAGGSVTPNNILKDGTTTLLTWAAAAGGFNQFLDASSAYLDVASWPANNAAVVRTFSGTILRLTMETNSSHLAHLFVSQASAAPANINGSGVATLPALTAVGTGSAGAIGGASASGIATLPSLVATGTGAAGAIGGVGASGSATLPALTAVGTGSAGSLGSSSASGIATLPALTAIGTGNAGAVPPPPPPPDQGDGTPFPTPVLFPYEPNASDPVSEVISYVTNVITSRNDSEQRIALRRRSILQLKWRITAMNPQDAGKVAGLLYKYVNNRWYVPLWPDVRRIQGVNAGSYFVETTAARFNFSSKALVWRNPDECDIMDVTSVNEGVVVLSGSPSFNHALHETFLVPLGVGSLPQQFTLDRVDFVTGGVVEFTLDTTGMTQQSARVPTRLFRGVEVLTIHPTADTDAREEQWTINSERVGTDLGPFLIRPFSTTPVVGRHCSWILTSFQEIADFRSWLAARRGRKMPLWVPTYQDDFTLLAAAVQNAGSIDIAAVNFADTYFGSASRVHLAALFPDGTTDPMTVVTAETIAEGVERLFLEAPLVHALPLDTRLCLLVYARMTEDAITIEHLGPGLATATGGFTELPRESPA